MIEINEKHLRDAFRHPATKDFAFYGIAKRLLYTSIYGSKHFEVVRVYGRKTKTVAICWNEGYKDCQLVLGKFPGTANGYADAAEAIDHYFNQ